MHPTPVLLPGKSHGRRSLQAAVHGVGKSRTRLSNFTFTFHFHALEKEMAAHSSALAWSVPGTGQPGGLASVGSQSRTRLKRLSSSSRAPNLAPGLGHFLATPHCLTAWRSAQSTESFHPHLCSSVSDSQLQGAERGDGVLQSGGKRPSP